MDIKGTQKIKASRQIVFNALSTPEVLKNSIPGCQSAEFVDFPTGRELKLVIAPNIPGFKGPYEIYLESAEVVEPSHLKLFTEPKSVYGSIKAFCTIDLTEEVDGTLLSYFGQSEMTGKIAATPDIILNGVVKTALSQFFKNFEKNVNSIAA